MSSCKPSEINLKWNNNDICIKCPNPSNAILQNKNSFLCLKECKTNYQPDSTYPQFCINKNGSSYIRKNVVPKFRIPTPSVSSAPLTQVSSAPQVSSASQVSSTTKLTNGCASPYDTLIGKNCYSSCPPNFVPIYDGTACSSDDYQYAERPHIPQTL